jgi:hypothetical protein
MDLVQGIDKGGGEYSISSLDDTFVQLKHGAPQQTEACISSVGLLCRLEGGQVCVESGGACPLVQGLERSIWLLVVT